MPASSTSAICTSPPRAPVTSSIIAPDTQQAYDLLLVVGGKGARRIKGSTPEGEAIKTACLNSKQFGSICTGAFVLASLGLLGKNATTHWKQKLAFAQQYPDVQLSIDSLFVRDGNV